MKSATKHPLVTRLEDEFLPFLRGSLQDLSQVSSRAKASVFALPVGVATSYQGYHLGISSLLSVVADSETDEVALLISVCHLDREPRLNAEVVWGSGKCEIDLAPGTSSPEAWPFATSERIAEVKSQLPRLVKAPSTAIQNGAP